MRLEPVKFSVSVAVLLRDDKGEIVEDGTYQSPPFYTVSAVRGWLDGLPAELDAKASDLADGPRLT